MAISDRTIKRLKMLNDKLSAYKKHPEKIPDDEREEIALMFASTFKEFEEFAELSMLYLGFQLSPMQRDIARYMQYSPLKRMVQAQRGEAKSTIAVIYCVWRLIRDPSSRIMIISAGDNQASDVALLVIRFIMHWGILCWLRPDASRGDRTSAGKFDVHGALKGIDKSASVFCVGITAGFTGSRADLVLADDIEIPRNSGTQTEREKLLERSKEFSAIAIKNEILYLGTPQSKDSVYRSLPARGFDVRVWSGRYPTNEELARYGTGVQIAPIILEQITANPELQTGGGIEGNRGQPTDPAHINEMDLQAKELDYGEEGFNLQYMLDTTLADALRTKIKLTDMPVIGCGYDNVPETLEWLVQPNKALTAQDSTPYTKLHQLYYASGVSDVFIPLKHKVMTLDPAGSKGDELAFAIGGATNSYIYILSVGGFRGGCSPENMDKVLLKMLSTNTKLLDIEKNMGHGTVGLLFQSHTSSLITRLKNSNEEADKFLSESGLDRRELITRLQAIQFTEYSVSTQKEKRIIDTISPVSRRHKLVLSTNALKDDYEYCQQHSSDKRMNFSFLYQLSSITYDRGSLIHDDRADCIQRIVESCKGFLSADALRAAEKRVEADVKAFMNNPMGYSKDVLNQGSQSGRLRRAKTPRRRVNR